jgi:hypothetical protein
LRHVYKRHGNEKDKSQRPVTKKDVLAIPETTGKYDSVTLSKNKRTGDDVLHYIKKNVDTTHYLESINRIKKRLMTKTMWIRKDDD